MNYIVTDFQHSHCLWALDILRGSKVYIDTSPIGTGKSTVTMAIAVENNYSLVVLSPQRIHDAWRKKAIEQNVQLQLLTIEEMSQFTLMSSETPILVVIDEYYSLYSVKSVLQWLLKILINPDSRVAWLAPFYFQSDDNRNRFLQLLNWPEDLNGLLEICYSYSPQLTLEIFPETKLFERRKLRESLSTTINIKNNLIDKVLLPSISHAMYL